MDAGHPRPRVYTPEGTYTSQRTGGSPSPNSDFKVLKLWGVILLIELLIVALLAAGVGAAGGYLYVKWEYRDWEEKLEKKERYLMEFEKYLKKNWEELVSNKKEFEERKKELEKEVRELQDRRELLESTVKRVEREFEELINETEKLEKEVNRLKEMKAKLKKDIKAIIRGAEQKAHENLIRELRSLRVQKSAILDLFDKYPELEEFLRKKEGLGIREYLERAKKLRAKAKDKGG